MKARSPLPFDGPAALLQPQAAEQCGGESRLPQGLARTARAACEQCGGGDKAERREELPPRGPGKICSYYEGDETD